MVKKSAVQSSPVLKMPVYAREVETIDTSGCERWINLLSSPDSVKSWQGRVMFYFPDYEEAEFVFAVPEVRHFVRALHQRVRHLFYFLALYPETAQLLEFMAAFSPDNRLVPAGKGHLQVQAGEQAHRELLERLVATWRFAEQVGDNPKRVVRGIAEHVYQPNDLVGMIVDAVGAFAPMKSSELEGMLAELARALPGHA